MRRFFTLSISSAVIAASFIGGCAGSYDSMASRNSPKPILVDEYSALDDAHGTRPMSDQALQRKLDEARRHYLLAMRSSEKGNNTLASRHFEAAITILNDLVNYPNIYSNQEFSKLSESVVRDYEEQVTSLDSLDANSSFFVLRDKIFQEIETLPIDKHSYASRTTIPGEKGDLQIALSDNTPVQQCIQFFTSDKGRKFFTKWLERSGRFFPMFDKILAEEGAPRELRNLAMIESGLNSSAVSWAKAVGLWQFIPGTGSMYGLNINWMVDERRNPEKATHAAARYLLDLYKDLGDWHLALASYNCGPNRVKSAIAKAGGSHDYWKVREFLPRETQQYVPLFIAASKIAMDPAAYGFTNLNYEKPEEYDEVPVKGGYDLSAIATTSQISLDGLQSLNRELIQNRVPIDAKAYMLHVPVGKGSELAAQLQEVSPEQLSAATTIQHKVKRGESLASISHKFNVDQTAILAANRLDAATRVKAGMTLQIPLNAIAARNDSSANTLAANVTPVPVESVAAAPTPNSAKPARIEPTTLADASPQQAPVTAAPTVPARPRHSVDPVTGGEQHLASAAPVTIETQLPPTSAPGKRIAAKASSSRQVVSYHTVTRGETLEGIARKSGLSLTEIADLNGLDRRTNVIIGQRLKIPGSADVAAETPSNTGRNRNQDRQLAARDERNNDRGSRASKRSVTTTSTRYEEHKVRRGESLASIADRYGVSEKDLRNWNSRDIHGHSLLAGSSLKIYSDAPQKGDSRRNSRISRSSSKHYNVRRGDTIEDIADRFGVSAAELRRSNPGLRSNRLKAGQTIKIQRN